RLVLSELQVASGVAAEFVPREHVEELAVAGGIVAGGRFEVARALALEGELGAAQAEVVVQAVAGVGVEVEHVAVVPVAVGLQQAFEADVGTGDRIDRDLRVRGATGQQGQQGKTKEAGTSVHGRLRLWRREAGYGVNVALR